MDNPDGLQAPDLYDSQVDSETREFMKLMTGIQDENELRAHILDVQAKAFTVRENTVCHASTYGRNQVARYPCITSLQFLRYSLHCTGGVSWKLTIHATKDKRCLITLLTGKF